MSENDIGQDIENELEAAFKAFENDDLENTEGELDGAGASGKEGLDADEQPFEEQNLVEQRASENEQASPPHKPEQSEKLENEQGGVDDVIPPTWSKHRKVTRKARRLKRDLIGAEKRLTELEAENSKLKAQQDYISRRLGDEAVEMPSEINHETIENIREELGDNIADALEVLRANNPLPQAPQEVTAPHENAQQETSNGLSDEFYDFMDTLPENSIVKSLEYWAEEKPKMFSKANEIADQLSKNPEFNQLNEESFYSEVVKQTIASGEEAKPEFKQQNRHNQQASSAPATAEHNSNVPASLSEATGDGGQVSTNLFGDYQSTPAHKMDEFMDNLTPQDKAKLDDMIWG